MATINILRAVYMHTESKACTAKRADDILQCVDEFLVCMRPSWRQRIEEIFRSYVALDGDLDIIDEINNRKTGLYWSFHRRLVKSMCLAWEAE